MYEIILYDREDGWKMPCAGTIGLLRAQIAGEDIENN